jgi:ankyrin repeat protein
MKAAVNNRITDLMKAVSKGDVDAALALIGAGLDVNERDVFGHTALMFAAGEGHLELVQVLLSQGAEVNASNQVGATALSRATAKGHTEIVRLLRSAGAIDKSDTEGRFAREDQLNRALLHSASDGDIVWTNH